MVSQETVAVIVFRERDVKQENFFYMDAACQTMVLFCGKMRFMLAYILSLRVVITNNNVAMIVEKSQRKLRCRKADKQQQRNAEAI